MNRQHRGRPVCRFVSTLLVLAFAVGSVASVAVTQEVTTLSRADTSRSAREDAKRGIPFQRLSREAQQRIAAVVKKPTMFRRMPINLIQCDPEMHRFVIRQPEVMVNIWQIMGITQVKANRVAPFVLQCSDGVGTVTDLELIYGDSDTHVIFCEGAYDGPLFRKPLTGRCVLVLKSGAVQNHLGSYQITNRLDVFLQIDHVGLDIFAKTLHPLLGKSADLNFSESMRFLERMSQAAEANGDGMQHLAGRLQDVQPDVRTNFQRIVSNVNQRSVERIAARSEPVRPPARTPVQAQPTQPRSAMLPHRAEYRR